MSLKLYFHPLSSFCHKALIALYECGVSFEPILVDLSDDKSSAALRSLWPMAKFPVLRDEARNQTVAEATVIVEYLGAHYPGDTQFVPAETDLAWQTRMWDRFYDNYVHLQMQKIVGDWLRPAGATDPFGVEHAKTTLQRAYGMIEHAMDGMLAYGNIQQGPWEWSAAPEFRDFVSRHFGAGNDMLGFQMAFDVTGDPAFPEKAAFEVARDLGVPVTTHAGVWGATNDDGIRLMHEHGFMTPSTIYVHAATLTRDSYHRIAATGGTASVSTESEQSAGQGYPPTWQLREHNIPVSLSMDTSVWWSGDLFSAMRTTLGADRSREHLEAHGRQETVTHCHLRAEDVVDWATRGGARALGLDSVTGSLEPGKKADVVLIKNDASPVMFPLLNPYGHVAFQAQRGDVHTVLVNGQVVKSGHALTGGSLARARQVVGETVEFLQGQLGPEAWAEGMHPEVPETKVLDNPYTYTKWDAGSAQWKGGAGPDAPGGNG